MLKNKDVHNLGHKIVNIGMGLLFVWGGLEKFFEGFMSGPGLNGMSQFLGSIGFGFLGDTGTFVLAIIVAAVELIAGIMLLVNYKVNAAYTALTAIIIVAVLLVHLPGAIQAGIMTTDMAWMGLMTHIGLLSALAGMMLMTSDCGKK